MTLRMTFARACRDTRIRLDVSQQNLADSIGATRGYIANIETGRANPSLDQAERIATVLGLEIAFSIRPPIFVTGHRPNDVVHARCIGYVDRRLRRAGWETAGEVEVVEGRAHGWVDLVAFDPRTGTLLVIEVKTMIDDLGAIERHLAWYGRLAPEAAIVRGWPVRQVAAWLILLASDEVDVAVRLHRDVVGRAFPVRAPQMLDALRTAVMPAVRGMAMIDPASRRRDWLLRTRLDGRRSAAPYAGYADAARRLGGRS